jgi:hypothetical protein
MAKSTNSPSQTISAPKGGGALQGIGEKFAPDLHTGTGNLTIPIALPPGRNGLQPDLQLVYSTGHGNGPFGLGWSLSVPGVSRNTTLRVPFFDDRRDVFILSGAEDLVPVPGAEDGAQRYRPRTEGLFARITHHHNTHDDYWRVETKDGLISDYGTPALVGSDPAVVCDPQRPTKVFSWKLTATRDPFNNRIVYEYDRDRQAQGSRTWDQIYLRTIRYADFNDDGGQIRFRISVTFVYSVRPDPFSLHRCGFEIRSRRRCERI